MNVLKGEMNSLQCLSLGFNSNSLQCNICDNLLKITDDFLLFEECKECCKLQGEEEKYELIILESDQKILKRYENILNILQELEELNVIMRYKYRTLPTLLMYKERIDDEPTEIIEISSWSSDTLIDYIKSHQK